MKIILPIFYVLCGYTAYGQNIVAGAYDINEYYHDFIPDEILLAPAPVNWTFDSLYMDLNNDGTNDVIVNVHNLDGGNWERKKHAEIIPFSHAEISLGEPDTCFANCPPPDYVSIQKSAQSYDFQDSIDASGTWTNTPLYLAFTKQEAAVPNGCGYSCEGGAFDTTFSYVGVRIFDVADTLYGWIKLSVFATNPGDFDVAIDAYACNIYVLSNGELSLPKKELVRVVDILGRETNNRSNELLIHVYSDGSTEKVFKFQE